MSPSPGKSSSNALQNNQGLATLLVMIAVLTIIVLFCCFSAPGIRDLCRRYIFRSCEMDDPDADNVSTTAESTSPTIILLPYGRMVVVDRAVFAHLDHSSRLDFIELSSNLMSITHTSNPSIIDSEPTSKRHSPILGLSPPAYEEIFGNKDDLPPSYSEVSLMLRQSEILTNSNEECNLESVL